MTIEDFNKEYASKGGYTALEMMKNELRSLNFIALHFGVTQPTVKAWIKDLFDLDYDVKPLRKERIIEQMVKFAETHSEEEFREAYYYVHQDYFSIALAEIYARGIYKGK